MMISIRTSAQALLTCRGKLGKILVHAIGSLWRGTDGGGEPEWSSAAGRAAADLERLNHATEKDFLAVGGKLNDFLSLARQISSDMASLIELFSGGHTHKASQELERMLEHAAGMSAGIERRSQALATVQKLSRRIQFAFLKVAETVAVFRTLCTLTRIETSRLGDDGSEFGDLAAEVKPLSERIHSTGQGILDAAVRLDENIRAALQKEADLSARELKELDSLIAGVTGSLHSFEERLARALQASEFQTAQHQAVCGAMQDLVGSIQFQRYYSPADRTRLPSPT